MSNNKFDAAFFDPQPGKYTGPPDRKLTSKRKRQPAPLPAKIGATALLLGLVLLGFFGCQAATQAGLSYEECIDQIAQESGHDAAKIAMREGECR